MKKILLGGIILSTFIPQIAFAEENQYVNSPEIIIKNSLSRAATKEAVVKNTAKQNFSNGKWYKLFNVTYKSIWFRNGVVQTGYKEIGRKNGWDVTEYTWAYTYRTW